MQFFITMVMSFAVAATAIPTLEVRDSVCPPGISTANLQCCAVDVEGVADLDCGAPSRQPRDGEEFRALCSEKGASAMCCSVPVAGQDLVCQNAIGAQG